MNHLGFENHVCPVTERVKVPVETGNIAKTLYIKQKFDILFEKNTSKIQDYIILLPICDQREWMPSRSTKLVSKGVEIRMDDSWSLVYYILKNITKHRDSLSSFKAIISSWKYQLVTNWRTKKWQAYVSIKPKVTATITIHYSHHSACPLKHY